MRTGALILLAAVVSACGDSEGAESPAAFPPQEMPSKLTLRLAGFTTIREPLEKFIIPEFQRSWRSRTGQQLEFVNRFEASVTLARALTAGFEADIASLATAEEMESLVEAGLVPAEWKSAEPSWFAATSLVVIAARKGNPLGIRDWEDLARDGVGITLPDPTTSGGGRWNVAAIAGASWRRVAAAKSELPASSKELVRQVFAHALHRDLDARSSFDRFLAGTGDAAVTAESEVCRAMMFGHECAIVVPPSTLRIQYPVAVVRRNAERHGVAAVAESFRRFLWTEAAQRAFARCGFRPVRADLDFERERVFARVGDVWTIDDLGGWEALAPLLGGPAAIDADAGAPVRVR